MFVWIDWKYPTQTDQAQKCSHTRSGGLALLRARSDHLQAEALSWTVRMQNEATGVFAS